MLLRRQRQSSSLIRTSARMLVCVLGWLEFEPRSDGDISDILNLFRVISDLVLVYSPLHVCVKKQKFVSHAVLSLCRSEKSRIADDFIYSVQRMPKIPIPDYVISMHTKQGDS